MASTRLHDLSPADAAILAEAANGIIGLETSLGLALGLVNRGVIDRDAAGHADVIESGALAALRGRNTGAGIASRYHGDRFHFTMDRRTRRVSLAEP